MIDPIVSLAFSLHGNKGIYALLLGSGVSRAAQIPTGWEVVVDLINKLALVQGENCQPDPSLWYRNKYGEEPNYSTLLDALAKTPEERQQLLRGYFEPDREQRDQGLKMPTAAHRAIATLVAEGYIRVILTTNFDRLTERAIEDAGITPTVISTVDGFDGCLPVAHQRALVLKLHGDYLDTRIRNTPAELGVYDTRVNAFLDRILDEFGLIVCGWSAQWDEALRSAIQRCKSRRFSTYWTARGDVGDYASRLIAARSGEVIKTKDADSFFADLSEKVLSLRDLDRPHPLSVAAATAAVKRLLADDKGIIRLSDLVRDETEIAFDAVQVEFSKTREPGDQATAFKALVNSALSATEIIRAMNVQCARWGSDQHHQICIHPIQRLATDPNEGKSGVHIDDGLRKIPAVILLYEAGISAVAERNIGVLRALLAEPLVALRDQRAKLLTAIKWDTVQGWFGLLSARKYLFPASERLFTELRRGLKQFIPDDLEYEYAFDQFEIIRSLVFCEIKFGEAFGSREGEVWAPAGRFVWKFGQQLDNDPNSVFAGLLQDKRFSHVLANPTDFVPSVEKLKTSTRKMAERRC